MWVENKQKPIASKRLVMRLIMQNNLHEDLLSLVGWWETILELLSWLDRIIHNAYQFYSYPPLIFPRKQIMQSRKISCNMTMREYAHWTMLTVMLDSCDQWCNCDNATPANITGIACWLNRKPAKSSSVIQMLVLQCHMYVTCTPAMLVLLCSFVLQFQQ